MATLEKIRSKSVLLFVIIIVALLAFILGDFLNSGRSYFGSGTTMYSAGSRKVDYNDYQKQIEALDLNGADADEQRQALMQQMLLNDLVEEQYDLLGITVTDKEISELMNNQMPLTQQLAQSAQALGLPATTDRSVILDAIKNPARYGLTEDHQAYLKTIWMSEEAQVEAAIKNQALMSLITGLFTANEVDAKAAYDNSMVQFPVQYVSTSVTSIPDADVEVSDADIKAQWEEIKPMLAVEVYQDLMTPPSYDQNRRDTRAAAINETVKAIDYVAVDIVPSPADYEAAQAEVLAAKQALEQQPGLEGLVGHDRFSTDSYKLSKADMSRTPQLRSLPDSALAAGAVTLFPLNRTNNTFTIAKVLDRKAAVDSINSTVFFMPATQSDSIWALVKGGTPLDSIIAQNPGQGYSDRWARMEAAQYQPNDVLSIAEIRERLADAAVGQPNIYTDSINGIAFIYKANEKKAPVEFYDIVIANYTVDPSAQTISDLKQTLSSFLASNHSGDAFTAKADSLYNLQHGLVSASSAHIGNMAGTRQAVKWAMNAKPGQVSPIFDTPKEYVVVAVKETFNDYIPYNSPLVKESLAAQARLGKKAAKMIDKIGTDGKSLQDYAAKMDADVQTDSAVVFNSQRVGTHYGDNHKMLAAISAAQPGQIVGPFQNDNEVVVFVVGDASNENRRPYNFESDGASFVRDFGIPFNSQRVMNPAIFKMFVGNREVKNSSLNFERDVEE